MLEIIKNSILTNNKKEIDATKTGKNFAESPRDQSPRIQSPSAQTIRPESSFSGMPF